MDLYCDKGLKPYQCGENVTVIKECGESVKYYLLRGRSAFSGDFIYSVLIESSDGDCEYAYDVSRDKNEALRILRLLSRETVMPCSLLYALDEIISGCEL